jgi:nanoRNase/pAp phosphatase (c-di-AMP/oligoRNAs hydrolase)
MKDTVNSVVELIKNAKRIAIMPSKIAGEDAFCAGVGLYNMLKDQDKRASFVYTGKIPEGCEDLINENEVTSDVFERELMVSIDYSDTPAARVHYSTENDILYLNVKPIDKNFDLDRVTSAIKGFEFDVIITLGAQDLEDFGQTYSELELEFTRANIINIDNTEKNSRYGLEDVLDASVDTLSLLVLQKASQWDLTVTKKAGKALLTGISNS